VPLGKVAAGLGGNASIKTYMCPSAPTRTFDISSYFVAAGAPNAGPEILGVTDYAAIRDIDATFKSAGCAPLSPTGNVGALGVPGSGVVGGGGGIITGKVKITDITDGTSNTLMIAEDGGRPQVYANGIPLAGSTYGTAGYTENASWADYYTYITIVGWGADGKTKGSGCNSIGASNHGSLYSFHTGGVNAVRCDGSVSFMPTSTSSSVLAALASKQGGEVYSDAN